MPRTVPDCHPGQASGRDLRRKCFLRSLLRHLSRGAQRAPRNPIQGARRNTRGEWLDGSAAAAQPKFPERKSKSELRCESLSSGPSAGGNRRSESWIHRRATRLPQRPDGFVPAIYRPARACNPETAPGKPGGRATGIYPPDQGIGDGLLRRKYRDRVMELRPTLCVERQLVRLDLWTIDPGGHRADLRSNQRRDGPDQRGKFFGRWGKRHLYRGR